MSDSENESEIYFSVKVSAVFSSIAGVCLLESKIIVCVSVFILQFLGRLEVTCPVGMEILMEAAAALQVLILNLLIKYLFNMQIYTE